jgi:hypothetical protein
MALKRFGGDGGGPLHGHWFDANWADCTEASRRSTRIHERDDGYPTATGSVLVCNSRPNRVQVIRPTLLA